MARFGFGFGFSRRAGAALFGIAERYFGRLTRGDDTHYTIPKVTYTGDFKLTLDFQTTNNGNFLGDIARNEDTIGLTNGGLMSARVGGTTLPLSAYRFDDGRLHHFELERISGNITVKIDGLLETSGFDTDTVAYDVIGRTAFGNRFDQGVIANVIFYDSDRVTKIRNYPIDEDRISTVVVDTVGGQDGTAVNLGPANAYFFTKSGSAWNGLEALDNGDFSNGDTDWTLTAGQASVINEELVVTSGFNFAHQDNVSDTNWPYKFSFDYENTHPRDNNFLEIKTQLGGSGTHQWRSPQIGSFESGTFTDWFITNNGGVSFGWGIDVAAFDGIIDNASYFKYLEINPNPVSARNFTLLAASGTQRYTFPTVSLGANDWEVECKFATTTSSTITMFSGASNFNTVAIQSTNAGDIFVFCYVGGLLQPTISVSNASYLDGNLHTIALQYTNSNDNVDLIIDGVVVASNTWPMDGSQEIFNIGSRAGTNTWDGYLSDFKVTDNGVVIRDYLIDEDWVGPSTVLVDSSASAQDGTAILIDDSDAELFRRYNNVSPNEYRSSLDAVIMQIIGT